VSKERAFLGKAKGTEDAIVGLIPGMLVSDKDRARRRRGVVSMG
jgi:hypothetical protein